MPRKKTPEEFAREVRKLVENEYEIIEPYVRSDIPIKMKHVDDCGEIFTIRPSDFLRGIRCKVCKPHLADRLTTKIVSKKTSP